MTRSMTTDIQEYFTSGCGRCDRFGTPDCSTRIWRETLAELRAICLGAGLEEHVKWGHPCYVHGGRNVAILGAFRAGVRVGFFHAALLDDPANVLERQGPNTRHPDCIRFTDTGSVAAKAAALRACLAEAMDHAAAGRLPPKEDAETAWPEELVGALAADAELSQAFHALTPGRQRSYVINLTGAKASATRMSRIARFRPRIIAGKGATER